MAFRAIAYKAGKKPDFFKKQSEVVKLIPYESENQFSAVFFHHQGILQFAMKGAVEVLLTNG